MPLLLAALGAACGDDPAGPGATGRISALNALSVGEQHACALTSDGVAWCWGDNSSGQLGTGTFNRSTIPARVSGGLRFQAIHAGSSHTCALTTSGDAWCWGANTHGQLGTGRPTSEWEPVRVAGDQKFVALAAGGYQHSCGRTAAGEVYCWGGDRNGQLGYPAVESCPFGATLIGCSRTPVAVVVGGGFTAVTAGFLHTCGTRAAGGALCWGDNSAGQLGSGTSGQARAIADVTGVSFSALSGGSLHSCGLDPQGRAHCWGDNSVGAVGAPANASTAAPVVVGGGLAFRSVSTSRGNSRLAHTCAVVAAGQAYCWGAAESGQLGQEGAAPELCDAGIPCSRAPVAVAGPQRWVVVAAGTGFSCGISTEGAVFCWGANGSGQLGNGGTIPAATPTAVSGSLRLPSAL